MVYYVDFPSRSNDVQNVSKSYVSPIVKSACVNRVTKVHFVTHSAGGIILRYFLKENKLPNLGRVVMLSPPNMGSEVADFLTDFSFLNFLFGPMLFQLRTEKSSFVNMIGLPNFEYGVIMGNSSYDFISSLIIPGDDDGKVSIERSKLANTKEFMLVNRTHTFIMDGPEVQRATFRFIQSGKFE
ncbi:alpha/beta hydrolase [Leptospira wolffii]|uniref:Alpha/beta hydrolase n=1 Tax=Leptospira wolffii TaxID=409998 RepID=A0A2M9Z6P0_9LEPT|nr:alpha/beta hydrolase [Leptospira wolffii]